MSSMTDHSMKEGLLALAERCEAATRPDRELDEEIALACKLGGDNAKAVAGWLVGGSVTGPFKVAAFTASLDAALTLVPEGCEWLRKSPNTMSVYHLPSDEEWANHIDGTGATPALALCAAALRSHSTPSMKDEDDD